MPQEYQFQTLERYMGKLPEVPEGFGMEPYDPYYRTLNQLFFDADIITSGILRGNTNEDRVKSLVDRIDDERQAIIPIFTYNGRNIFMTVDKVYVENSSGANADLTAYFEHLMYLKASIERVQLIGEDLKREMDKHKKVDITPVMVRPGKGPHVKQIPKNGGGA